MLEAYPAARQDGLWTLQELWAFARDQKLPEQAFLRELAQTAGAGVGQTERSADPSPLPMIFVALVVVLTLGGGWGVDLLLRIAGGGSYADVSAAGIHVHGVAQLWGWMAMFVFAVSNHLLRQNTKHPSPRWPQTLGTIAIAAAIPVFFLGLSTTVRSAFAAIDVVASALLLAAAVLFSISILWSLLGRAGRPQLWHYFVFMLVAWLWAWCGTDLAIRILSLHRPVPTDAQRSLLIILPVLGFAINAVYGFGIRLIPGLLNLAKPYSPLLASTLIAHNLGLCLLLIPTRATGIIGTALMLAAAIAYVIGLRGLVGRRMRPIYGVDPRGHILIRVAFFWLIVALAMVFAGAIVPSLPHPYAGAWRHALTVGFITTLILGVGQRIVPVFIKQPLHSTRLLLIGAGFIILGNAMRVSLELLTIGHWPWAFHWMGLSGLLELTALALFAYNILKTAIERRHVYRAGEKITPNTRIREAVNVYPRLQCRLREMGVDMFNVTPFIAPSLTFGGVALGEGKNPRNFVREMTASNIPSQAPA